MTGTKVSEEATAQVSSRFLTMFTTLLLVFAGIALLVATFTIHNTFAIVVAQRTRENALLRALGAARRQVLGATLAEAVVVGLAASVAGLLGGIGVAAGLKSLFKVIGFSLPTGGLVISAVSVALPLLVGTVTAVGSAVAAVRAGRTAPLAAMRAVAVDGSADGRAYRVRWIVGALLIAAGVAGTVVGATDGPSVGLTAGGAVATLLGVVVLGPVFATFVVRLLGAPLPRLRGMPGVLAQRNATRNPKRTAATASALMVGVTVVSLFTVFGASIKATMDDTVSRTFAGDLAISTGGFRAGRAQPEAGGRGGRSAGGAAERGPGPGRGAGGRPRPDPGRHRPDPAGGHRGPRPGGRVAPAGHRRSGGVQDGGGEAGLAGGHDRAGAVQRRRRGAVHGEGAVPGQ